MERRGRAGNIAIAVLLALIFPAAYLLSQAVVAVAASVVAIIASMFGGGEPGISGDLLMAVMVVSGALTTAAAVLTVALRKQNVAAELRLRNPGGAALILALMLGVALNVASITIMELLPIPEWMLDSYSEQVTDQLLGGSPVVTVLTVGILVPIFEEIALRAMPLRALRRTLSTAAAAVVGGAIFALIHGNIFQILYVLPVGIVFCFVFMWTESVFTSAAMHIGYNSFSAVLSVLPLAAEVGEAAEEPETAVIAIIAAISTLLSAALIWAIHAKRVKLVPIGNELPINSSDNGVNY